MKSKKNIMLGFACALLAITFGASHSLAAGTWCDSATLTKVSAHAVGGASSVASAYTITATCADVPVVWSGERLFYIALGDYSDSLYATALTAMSIDKKVRLKLAGAAPNNGLCLSMELLAN